MGIFFQLSGFLCSISAHRDWCGAQAFLFKRGGRLLPAFWVSIVLGVLSEVCVRGSELPERFDLSFFWSLGRVLSGVHAWFPDLIFQDSFNGPTWSVSCEIFFSLIFTVLYPAVLTRMRLRWLLVMWVAMVVLLLATSFLFRALDMHNSPLKFLPIVRLPQFVLGTLLGRMHVLGAFRDLCTYAHFAALSAVLGLLTAALCAQPFASNPLYPFYISGLLEPLFSLLLAALSVTPSVPVQLSVHGLLSTITLNRVGRMSYSIYLLQSPTHRVIKYLGGFQGIDDAGCVPLWLFLPVLFVCSHISFTYVEQRCTLMSKRAAGTKRSDTV